MAVACSAFRPSALKLGSLSSAATRSRSIANVRTYAGNGATDFIKSTIDSNKVAVFSKAYCPFCSELKSLLSSELKIDFKCLELDTMGSEGDSIQASLLPLTGSRTVPQLFIGGKYIGGNSDTQALHAQGKLVPMLKEAGVPVNA
mmetsp:Transcript_20293/g.56540  ORF Transcript_20293/g.56540 Transcript_20293/m.56540 type:complete len:145 (-) Transcript_20293:230-664(-)|eukprot:CAMPEP_0202348118 /NCGR_PEP_ID=MMETSP1126-20121109/6187_1 /ASSEMBLY_ACC=CAM_ASM_000457 /TAXON_ID=3047 /ORGANISM="Dunaliella tertiolecta, Strain CCMP1320" /LENGTH=144 /DNA_ID=CAMNT_0048939763 /DNA_START=895 /DNA_END=1329 /DNA_ORIENTATION=-